MFLASLTLSALLLALAAAVTARRAAAPRLSAAPETPRPGDEVTVLLPVRDEEEDVLPCLETLLRQLGKPRIRVIDDGSTDATARLVRRRARGVSRLTLLEAGALPAGWRGKVHALNAGLAGVETPWVLSTDADTRHHPAALASALAFAREHDLAAVSLAGHQEVRGAAAHLLVPPVFALLDGVLGDWHAAATGGGPPVATGQFLLFYRDAWEECGGFAAIRGTALDDVAVATRLRERGHRTGFVRAPELLSVRMYRGLGEAVRGWRRNLGGLFGARPVLAAAVLAVLVVPPALALLALAGGRFLEAALLWTAGAAASAALRRGGGHDPLWGLLYPADALLLAAILMLGAIDRHRGELAAWKGRRMRIHPE